jgi:hypothetical protein
MQPAGHTVNDSSNSSAFDARHLRLWLATLSHGDLSVNEGAAARPGSAMITGIGSPNDSLWSQMERAGWAQQIAVDDLSMAGVASTHAFTEAGARAVTTALAELLSWNAQIMGLFNGFDPHTEPERVRQACSIFSRLLFEQRLNSPSQRKLRPQPKRLKLGSVTASWHWMR